MLRSRLLRKLYAGYVALIAMTALVVGMLHSKQVEEDARQDTIERLRGQAAMLAELSRSTLEKGEVSQELQERLAALSHPTEVRFTVIRADGTVLADSHEQPDQLANQRQRPEVRLAHRRESPAVSDRYSATLQENLVYYAERVDDDGRLLGYVRTARHNANLAEHIATLRSNMAIAILAVALLGCLVGYFFVRQVTDRLRTMTTVAESMATGNHHQRVEAMGTDEVGKLARAFNTMAAQLEHRFASIAKERTELLAILKSMVEGVVAVDQDQRIMLINDEARRILGTPTGDLTERPIWEVTRLSPVCNILDLALRGAQEARDEVVLPMRKGDRYLELHATQLRTEHNVSAGAIVVIHDITGLRHLENVRRDFVTNVSHELKTPLTAIRGFVETLIDNEDADADTRRRFLGKINDHSLRLTTLVSDLLTLARVESHGVRAERKPLDLRDPVRESLSLLASRADAKSISLVAEIPDRAIHVVGEAEMLRQVVDNLLDNAIKYTPEDGTVTLRVDNTGDVAKIAVEDNGVGLDPVDQQRIFERFYRVDRARSRDLGGTGLGLSIVKHVVQGHQGTVSVSSVAGAGSTFTVALPLAGTQPQPVTNGHVRA